MKRNTSFIVLLVKYGWFPVLCAVIAVSGRAWMITKKPSEFVAIGKLVVARSPNPGPNPLDLSKIPEAFYGTLVEILKSGELRRRTVERVREEHPELKEIDVEIHVAQTKGSGILNVGAIGAEPKFTRIYLDTLLYEFVAFRREMEEKSIGSTPGKVIEEVLLREKEVKKRAEELDVFLKQNDMVLIEPERERLAKLVSTLRGEVENLERSDQAAAKLKETREFLAQTEKRYSGLADECTKLEQFKRNYESANKDYSDWKNLLNKIDATQFSWTDIIHIMERPATDLVDEPDLVLPVVVAAFVGLIVGIVLQGVVIALLFKRDQPPAPLPPH